MTQGRLFMRKIYEVLRLTGECQLSRRAVARSCCIGYGTVCAHLQRAQAATCPEKGIIRSRVRSATYLH